MSTGVDKLFYGYEQVANNKKARRLSRAFLLFKGLRNVLDCVAVLIRSQSSPQFIAAPVALVGISGMTDAKHLISTVSRSLRKDDQKSRR